MRLICDMCHRDLNACGLVNVSYTNNLTICDECSLKQKEQERNNVGYLTKKQLKILLRSNIKGLKVLDYDRHVRKISQIIYRMKGNEEDL